MQKRRMLAVGLAAAGLVLGCAGAVAAANTIDGPMPQGPTLTVNPSEGPHVPGSPDTPEPGDTPDAPPPVAPPTP